MPSKPRPSPPNTRKHSPERGEDQHGSEGGVKGRLAFLENRGNSAAPPVFAKPSRDSDAPSASTKTALLPPTPLKRRTASPEPPEPPHGRAAHAETHHVEPHFPPPPVERASPRNVPSYHDNSPSPTPVSRPVSLHGHILLYHRLPVASCSRALLLLCSDSVYIFSQYLLFMWNELSLPACCLKLPDVDFCFVSDLFSFSLKFMVMFPYYVAFMYKFRQ